MPLTRLLYLGYYFKTLDRDKFSKFMDVATEQTGFSKAAIWSDVLRCSLQYNISIMEYFLFRFYEKAHEQRSTFAGTGFMYEYQRQMNPKKERGVLENKYRFLTAYEPFIRHRFALLDQLRDNPELAGEMLQSESGKLVIKSIDGQCGKGVEVLDCSEWDAVSLVRHMEQTGNHLAEEFLSQHDDLMNLSPSGLNTVRIFTQLNGQHQPEILGCRLRVTVNSHVDNMAAGNLVAPIREENGEIVGPAVYSDITKEPVASHPVTGSEIVGFNIPFWKETLEMVKQAAVYHTGNRSIGWDVAITNQGPDLIEANHDWCKLVWQLPVGKGMKSNLQKYLTSDL